MINTLATVLPPRAAELPTWVLVLLLLGVALLAFTIVKELRRSR